MPAFDLDVCAGRAVSIVEGKLRGESSFEPGQRLHGKKLDAASIELRGAAGASLRKATAAPADEPLDVVVFLDGDNNLVLGQAGMVAFVGGGVFLWREAEFGASPQRYAGHDRDSFLKELAAAVGLAKERREILARRPGRERARAAVEFLLARTSALEEPPRTNPGYHVHEIAAAMAPIDEREQHVILEAVESAESAGERAALLSLSSGIPLSAAAFDPVARWLDEEHPVEVRRAAIWAASAIDNYRAGERFAGMLSLDEPQLTWLLSGLHHRRESGNRWLRNPQVAGSLLDLAGRLRAVHMTEGRHVFGNESYAVLAAMSSYFHPRMLPTLYEWAIADDHASSNQALADLQHLTGVAIDRGATRAYDDWWDKSSDVLGREYKLSEEKDLMAWLEAHVEGNEATQRMLQRLWQFEAAPPADRLLEIARGDNAARAGAAQAALAELWQAGRLAAGVKRAIVETFLRVELREAPASPEESGYRHLLIVAECRFPFPPDAWVEPNYEIAIGRPPAEPAGSWGAFSLNGEGEKILGSMSGGSYPGTPTARANCALREVDHSAGGEVVWRIDWKLETKLREKRP